MDENYGTMIQGRCLVCGATHTRKTMNPKPWIEAKSVWCFCGNAVHGVKWEIVNKDSCP